MGEVGKPLFRILSGCYSCVAVDVEPVQVQQSCDVLHVCYPFQIPDFVGITKQYIEGYKPRVTVINSTVAPGTTRHIESLVRDSAVVYSPVRGKHRNMESDMLRYKKFVAGSDPRAVRQIQNHFSSAGFQTDTFRTPELGELSKLLETSWLGILIAWTQEMQRFAERCGGTFEEVNAFIKEVDFLPSHIFPGHIGGHCVMPNIAILRTQFQSAWFDAIVESNREKQIEEQQRTSEVGATR